MGHHGCPHYSRKQIKQIKQVYLAAAATWIVGGFLLHTYRSPGFVGILILTVPIILYGLAYANADRITRNVEDQTATTNLLVIAVVFVTVLLDVSNQQQRHYTVYIMLAALILLLFSVADIWAGRHAYTVARHAKSAARTAAITLLIFVIYVTVIDRKGVRPTLSTRNKKMCSDDTV